MNHNLSPEKYTPSRYRQEIRNALLESTYSHTEANGQTCVVITEEHDHAEAVWNIDKMVEKITKTNETIFNLRKTNTRGLFEISRSLLGEKFLLSLKIDIKTIREHFNQSSISIFFNLFASATESHKLRELMESTDPRNYEAAKTFAKALNDCIHTIRSAARQPNFVFLMRKFQRRSDKNFKSLTQYFDNLFECHSKILIVRLDLGYRKADSWTSTSNTPASYQIAKQHREVYLKKLNRNSLSEHLIGYTWRMEYGLLKGYHYHFVLMFNGHHVREDITLAKRCGQLWQDEATEGQGLYFNCNAQKNNYKNCGIGLIHYTDESAIPGIKKIAEYITKPDYFIQLKPHNNDRTFGKGITKKKQKTKQGRPRSN